MISSAMACARSTPCSLPPTTAGGSGTRLAAEWRAAPRSCLPRRSRSWWASRRWDACGRSEPGLTVCASPSGHYYCLSVCSLRFEPFFPRASLRTRSRHPWVEGRRAQSPTLQRKTWTLSLGFSVWKMVSATGLWVRKHILWKSAALVWFKFLFFGHQIDRSSCKTWHDLRPS